MQVGNEESAKAIIFHREVEKRAEQKENERHIGLEDAMRQKSGEPELPLGYKGETLNDLRSVEASTAADEDERSRNGYDPPD